MSRLIPMSDLVADDLLLDRLGAREHAGSEPVAGLLAALADHADTPLAAQGGRRRITRKHRYLGPFAALVVAASGAGVAAAVTVPHHAADQAQKARVVKEMDEAARSGAPSALLSRLGLPRTTASTDARGLVLARGDDGTIVLVPAAATAQGGRALGAALPAAEMALSALRGGVGATDDLFGSLAGRSQADAGEPGGDDLLGASAGEEQGGEEQGADAVTGDDPASDAPVADATGTPDPGSTPRRPATSGKGGSGSAATPAGKGGGKPPTGSTPTVTPTVTPTADSGAAAADTTPLSQTLVSPAPAPTKPRKQPSVAQPGTGTTGPITPAKPTSAATAAGGTAG